MKLNRWIFQQNNPEKINIRGGLLFLGGVFVLSFAFSLWHSGWFSAKPVNNGAVQENLGEWIQVMGSHDQDREAKLQGRWNEAVQTAQAFWMDQPSRLQEALGLTISITARNIWMENNRLRSEIERTRASLDQFKRDEAARRQEMLGAAVLTAYRHDPSGGADFLAAFQREADQQRKIEERTAGRMNLDLETLAAQKTALREAVPEMYSEAIESARRSARMYDTSHLTRTRAVFQDLNAGLSWQRQPADYVEMAGVVRENLRGKPGVGGFVEFGWAAMIGLVGAMIWLGLTMGMESFRSGKSESRDIPANTAKEPDHEQIEVGIGTH
jgi:hypothetical protein